MSYFIDWCGACRNSECLRWILERLLVYLQLWFFSTKSLLSNWIAESFIILWMTMMPLFILVHTMIAFPCSICQTRISNVHNVNSRIEIIDIFFAHKSMRAQNASHFHRIGPLTCQRSTVTLFSLFSNALSISLSLSFHLYHFFRQSHRPSLAVFNSFKYFLVN